MLLKEIFQLPKLQALHFENMEEAELESLVGGEVYSCAETMEPFQLQQCRVEEQPEEFADNANALRSSTARVC